VVERSDTTGFEQSRGNRPRRVSQPTLRCDTLRGRNHGESDGSVGALRDPRLIAATTSRSKTQGGCSFHDVRIYSNKYRPKNGLKGGRPPPGRRSADQWLTAMESASNPGYRKFFAARPHLPGVPRRPRSIVSNDFRRVAYRVKNPCQLMILPAIESSLCGNATLFARISPACPGSDARYRGMYN